MKKLFLISIFINTWLFSAELKCQNNQCDVKETISFLGYNLYDIKYSKTEKEEKILLTYNVKIEKEKNINKMIEKFMENNKMTNEDKEKLYLWSKETIDTFKGATYEITASESSSILKINNQEKLLFKDKGSFSRKFFRIWTGEKPVDDELKQAILIAKNK